MCICGYCKYHNHLCYEALVKGMFFINIMVINGSCLSKSFSITFANFLRHNKLK